MCIALRYPASFFLRSWKQDFLNRVVSGTVELSFDCQVASDFLVAACVSQARHPGP